MCPTASSRVSDETMTWDSRAIRVTVAAVSRSGKKALRRQLVSRYRAIAA